jgi:hypothetical protein
VSHAGRVKSTRRPSSGAFQRRLTSENRTPDRHFLIEVILVLIDAEV